MAKQYSKCAEFEKRMVCSICSRFDVTRSLRVSFIARKANTEMMVANKEQVASKERTCYPAACKEACRSKMPILRGHKKELLEEANEYLIPNKSYAYLCAHSIL